MEGAPRIAGFTAAPAHAAEGDASGPRRDRSRLVQWVKQILPVSRQARAVAALLSPALWFRFAVAMARWQGGMIRRLRGDGAPAEILIRDRWLQELTRLGPYPIPSRVHGRGELDRYAAQGPVLYVTLHVALADMTLRALAELGYPAPDAVTGEGIEGYPVVGMNTWVPALPATPMVLMRMRGALLQGRSISCMIDRDHLSGSYSTNPMRLAARMGVPVIFCWGEISADGVVDVFFQPAPHLFSGEEDAIAEKLRFFQELRERILGAGNEVAVLAARRGTRRPKAAPQAEPGSRVA